MYSFNEIHRVDQKVRRTFTLTCLNLLRFSLEGVTKVPQRFPGFSKKFLTVTHHQETLIRLLSPDIFVMASMVALIGNNIDSGVDVSVSYIQSHIFKFNRICRPLLDMAFESTNFSNYCHIIAPIKDPKSYNEHLLHQPG